MPYLYSLTVQNPTATEKKFHFQFSAAGQTDVIITTPGSATELYLVDLSNGEYFRWSGDSARQMQRSVLEAGGVVLYDAEASAPVRIKNGSVVPFLAPESAIITNPSLNVVPAGATKTYEVQVHQSVQQGNLIFTAFLGNKAVSYDLAANADGTIATLVLEDPVFNPVTEIPASQVGSSIFPSVASPRVNLTACIGDNCILSAYGAGSAITLIDVGGWNNLRESGTAEASQTPAADLGVIVEVPTASLTEEYLFEKVRELQFAGGVTLTLSVINHLGGVDVGKVTHAFVKATQRLGATTPGKTRYLILMSAPRSVIDYSYIA